MARTRNAIADQARYLAELATPDQQPSKAEMRAESAALVAAYAGPIRRLPTFIDLKCYRCNHRGRVKVYRGERKRFKCSRCGALSL